MDTLPNPIDENPDITPDATPEIHPPVAPKTDEEISIISTAKILPSEIPKGENDETENKIMLKLRTVVTNSVILKYFIFLFDRILKVFSKKYAAPAATSDSNTLSIMLLRENPSAESTANPVTKDEQKTNIGT